MKVAVVGATGLVGTVILNLLESRNFPVTTLLPVASENSVGKKIRFRNTDVKVVSIQSAIEEKPDLAFFSAGGEASLAYAEKFAAKGTVVIDNSSAWRMDPSKKLIVPEVNGHELTENDKIIANPNCSTIQLVMAMAPLHQKYGIQRMVISTYQSITGTGVKAVQQLENEQKGIEGQMAYDYQIHQNCIPQCDVFLENDYTKEEMKLVHESRKILGAPNLKVTATAVRVPVVGGHSESVNVTFEKEFDVAEIKSILNETIGVVVDDNPAKNQYPMPFFKREKDDVFVGRIRRDESAENSLNLWIVADNLRKGAATNAIQIAEYLISTKKI
ncbi:MAG: aspartate-semialdehyde dehydrogenase [Vicingaceae bacterium]|jgi:aspartate-semialdehyde dehydrogenase